MTNSLSPKCIPALIKRMNPRRCNLRGSPSPDSQKRSARARNFGIPWDNGKSLILYERGLFHRVSRALAKYGTLIFCQASAVKDTLSERFENFSHSDVPQPSSSSLLRILSTTFSDTSLRNKEVLSCK